MNGVWIAGTGRQLFSSSKLSPRSLWAWG